MNERRILDALLGVYVAVLLVPAGVLAGWEAGAARLPITVFVGIGVVIAAVVAVVVRTVDDLVDRVVSLPVAVVTVCLPLLYVPYMIFTTEPGSTTEFVAVIGVIAVVLGIGALFIGSSIRTRRLCETATEIVVVTVGDKDNNQRVLRIAAVMIVAITLITAGAVTILTGEISTTTLTTALGGLSTVFLLFNNGKELAVTDAGFRVEQSIIAWDDLAGYRLTDDKVLLVRSEWYLPARRFDREDISDEDTLIEALEGFLPRIDEQGRVELAARR